MSDTITSADYSVTTETATGTITPATLTASITNDPTKSYDGTTTATLAPNNFSISGLVGGESFTVTADRGHVQQPERGVGDHGDRQPGGGRLHGGHRDAGE